MARILPSLVAAISPPHYVVTGEAGADEVLRAILHPLDRLVQNQGGDNGAHIARVDGHLVAETTADVR